MAQSEQPDLNDTFNIAWTRTDIENPIDGGESKTDMNTNEDYTEIDYNFPWFPSELMRELHNVQVGHKNKIKKNAFTRKLKYKGKFRVRIQSPKMTCMFGLSSYTHPNENGNNSNEQHYSIHIGLGGTEPEQKEFRQILEAIDEFGKSTLTGPPDRYCSAIRYNHLDTKLPPVLRVKIPQWGPILDINLYAGSQAIKQPRPTDLSHVLKHGSLIRCIIEISGLWYAAGKFGVSYKLVQIETFDEPVGSLFRTN